jgi:hypothetical protein
VESGTLVLVHLVSPKEKYWGVLQALEPAGLTMRGISVELFDDWARQHRTGGDAELGIARMFVPLHRIEKVFEDARVGSVASYAERFFEMVGRDVREVIGEAAPPGDLSTPN